MRMAPFLRFLLLLPLACILSASPQLSGEQKALLAKGYRFNRAGWIYLHVEGSPRP